MIRRYCIVLRDDSLFSARGPCPKTFASRGRAANSLLDLSAQPSTRAHFKWARVAPCLVYANGTVSVDPHELNANRSGDPR